MTEMTQNPGQFATNVPSNGGFGTNMAGGMMGMPSVNPYMTNLNAGGFPGNGMMQPGFPNQFGGNFGTSMGMGAGGNFGTNMAFNQPFNQPS